MTSPALKRWQFEPPRLERPLCRRPDAGRPRDPHQRHTHDCHRRDAGRLSISAACRSLETAWADAGTRRREPLRTTLRYLRTARGRRDSRRCACRDDDYRRGAGGEYPDSNAGIGVRTKPFTHAFVAPPPEAREPLVMMIAAAIVLLIACANGASLLLARASQRAREMAMRTTLGASRLRIVRQLLIEALLVAAAAALVGLAFSRVAVRFFARETVDMNLPFWIAFEFDARVFAFVAVACLGTAVIFGLVPAWQLSRTDPLERTQGRGTRCPRWPARPQVDRCPPGGRACAHFDAAGRRGHRPQKQPLAWDSGYGAGSRRAVHGANRTSGWTLRFT